MDNNFSCNVIQDLLPSYVDGICSEETAGIVKAHLATCESCRRSFEAMKQDDNTSENTSAAAPKAPSTAVSGTAKVRPSNPSSTSGVKIDEKAIMQKVNRKMHKNMLTNAILGIVVGALILTLAFFAIKPNKTIKSSDYIVSYQNMDLQELINNSSRTYFDFHLIPENSVLVFEEGKSLDDCEFIVVTIPGYLDAKLAVDKDYVCEGQEICVVTISSDYAITSFDDSVKANDGGNVLVLSNVKTPIFGEKTQGGTNRVSMIELCHIDEVEKK
ncbi:MAG: zf-HC2 domain-containing protein [Clostridiales bacterium]|nr:zf-HC2 domain-containing protein [Clostridiales bacterium]